MTTELIAARSRTRLRRFLAQFWRIGLAVVMARGYSNPEIASKLFISLATVKTHVGRVLEKLGMANRVQVALCVFESEVD